MLVRVFLKKGNIPENRGRLMQAFLSDIMRRENAQGAARTPLETKTTLLARLAFETRKLAMLSFTRIEACTWVKQKRDELGSTLDAPLFVDEILNNNLLSETSGGLLTFDHELYQEYFCAVALLEMGDKGVTLIEELQREPRWEEPIVIYSGISDRRSSVLQSLAISNILLAAKSLTSAAVDEGADRENIVLKAKALAADATEPSKVADALLSLAELGEAEEMIMVLKQRGAQDVTAQAAIRSFIPKCPPDLVVGWMQKTSDHSDKFLISWMITAIAPDQKEILLRDHRVSLKELLLWQFRRSWQGGKERKHLKRLLRFLGEEFRGWFIKSVAKEILARIDHGSEDQWQALKYLWQEEAELSDPKTRTKLFAAALNRGHRNSIEVAVLLWLRHFSNQDLSFVFNTVDEEVLQRSIRLLRKPKSIDYHRLSLLLSNTLREFRVRHLSENKSLLKTNTKRLDRLANMKVGEVRRSCLMRGIKEFGAFVELEPGIDGLLHSTDMNWELLTMNESMLEINQTIDVMVLEIDDARGNLVVGLKQMVFVLWDNAESKYPVGTRVKVKVLDVGRENALVELEAGVEGVIARSDLSWADDAKTVDILTVGEEVEAIVLGVDRRNLKFVLSLRLLQVNPWESIEQIFPVGSITVGKVTKLVDFGAFIRLRPGIDGLLHLTDMSWGRIKHPSEILNVGQEINLIVLEVNKEKERVSLGLKQILPNPWDNIESKFPVGEKVKGKVVSLVPYGAFVQLETGVEGLVHVTELSWTKRVAKPSDVLKQDQEIEAVVL
ncbi:MAG TPA: hypothetical protein DCQ92_17975, partial [Verrucomicrobia subdivision 3 bacterium]|nr:hypothetical protein [Limisphaerales bacterium]